jgi:hypothetical protein
MCPVTPKADSTAIEMNTSQKLALAPIVSAIS